MTRPDLERLSHALDEKQSPIRALQMRYAGDSPLAYLSPEARQALGNRLQRLSANFSRLAVDALSERLRVVGVETGGQPDAALWQAFLRSGGRTTVAHVARDFLALGQSGVSVWVDEVGHPVWRPESPLQVAHETDPVTGEVVVALKRWQAGGRAHAVLWEKTHITRYESLSHVPADGVIPANGWVGVETLPNPLGVLPFVPMVNRLRLDDVQGTSEMAAIQDLCDALEKLLSDSMVTSEYFARPRRWATGVEIVEDDEGNPIDPFANSDRTWISENGETKFGQFPNADPNFYRSMVDILTSQIGALSGLPASMLGQHADQPASAEAIYASNLTLTAKAEQKITTLDPSWSRAFAIGAALQSGGRVQPEQVRVVWADPQNSSEAQEADAAQKLFASGLISRKAALKRLGYSPDEIAEIESDLIKDAVVTKAAIR